jgi:uncharacterized Zn finger protein (UPF0148 family)
MSVCIYCPVCESFYEIEFHKLKGIDEEFDKKIHELHDKHKVIVSDIEDFKEIEGKAKKWTDFLKFREALEKVREHKKEYEDLIDFDFGD